MTILIIISILLLARLISTLLDVTSLSFKIIKTNDVTSTPNSKLKNYQFIKGLY